MTVVGVEDTLPLPPTITTTKPAASHEAGPGRGAAAAKWMEGFRKGATEIVGTQRGRFSVAHWLMFALFPTILLAAFVVTGSRKHNAAPPTAAAREYRLTASANVPGARFTVDDKAASFPVLLTSGPHTVKAFLAGYKTASQDVSIDAGTPSSQNLSLTLQPEPVQVRLSSDLKGAQVAVDQDPAQEIPDGQFSVGLSPGTDHTFAVRVGNKEALNFSFHADPGADLKVTSPLKAQDVDVLIVSTLEKRAQVYSSNPALKAGMHAASMQTIPPTGLALQEVPAKGDLILDNGKGTRPVPIEAGNAPIVNIILTGDPETATLQVECNVPDATVTIRGRPYPLRNGARQLLLRPGKVTIHVERNGYQSADQTVDLAKGGVVPARFDLSAIAKTGNFLIEGATPDAQIYFDGRYFARTDAQGKYETDGIPEGSHTIVLKKPEYEDKQLTKALVAGQPLRISGAEGQLSAWGTLTFEVPRDVEIAWRSEDGQLHGKGNQPVHLKAGHYLVSVRSLDSSVRGYDGDVMVQPGKTVPFTWAAPAPSKPVVVPPKASPPVEVFANTGEWASSGPYRVHTGNDIGWMRSNQGAFQLTVRRPKSGFAHIGGSHLTFVVDYKDERSRIEYSLDSGGTLERKVIVNGSTQDKHSTKFGTHESYSFRIEILPAKITVSSGSIADTFERPHPGEKPGRFGFKGDAQIQVVQEN
jgi:hypothetical protein